MARPTLFTHRKLLRLSSALGSRALALGHLVELWHTAYESTDAEVGDAVDVEARAGWEGEPGELVDALLNAGGPGRLGFLDVSRTIDGETLYKLHDFWDHAPDYVRKRRQREMERQEKGSRLAATDRSVTGREPVERSKSADADPPLTHTPAPAPAPAPAPLTACPVPSAADAASTPSEPVYLWVPIKGKVPEKKNNGPVREVADGSEFGIRESLVPEWEERYPGVDVRQQLRSLQGWNKRNSGRRKTYGGFLNHVEGWLAREQNKAGSNGRSSPKPIVSAARYVVPHETDEQRALTEKAMREEVFE